MDEEITNDQTGNETTGTANDGQQVEGQAQQPQGQQGEGGGEGGGPSQESAPAGTDKDQENPFAERDAFLDTLRAQPKEGLQARGEDGKFVAKGADQPGQAAVGPDGKPVAEAGAEKKEGGEQVKTPEQEAEALIKELGVKSPRSQDRIKQVFAERKQLGDDITEFKTMVKSTGMTPEDFAQSLEFGRLVHAGDEQSLRVALEMVEAQREEICKRLGVEAPGVDPLGDFPDLKQAVENMEITKPYALQLAKVRRQEHAQRQTQQAEQASQQEMEQYEQKCKEVSDVAVAYFKTREKEADFPAKFAQIQAYFANEKNRMEFIQTHQPEAWFGAIKFMYDSIKVAQPAAPRNNQQPIRNRSLMSGTPQPEQGDNVGRMRATLAQMGIGGAS